MTVLLSALATAIGAGVGTANTGNPKDAANRATQNPQTLTIISGIVLVAILLIAYYYCGGPVVGDAGVL